MSLIALHGHCDYMLLDPCFTEVNEYFFEDLSSEIFVYVAAAVSAASPAKSDFSE
jgi:hypothetical protein